MIAGKGESPSSIGDASKNRVAMKPIYTVFDDAKSEVKNQAERKRKLIIKRDVKRSDRRCFKKLKTHEKIKAREKKRQEEIKAERELALRMYLDIQQDAFDAAKKIAEDPLNEFHEGEHAEFLKRILKGDITKEMLRDKAIEKFEKNFVPSGASEEPMEEVCIGEEPREDP